MRNLKKLKMSKPINLKKPIGYDAIKNDPSINSFQRITRIQDTNSKLNTSKKVTSV